MMKFYVLIAACWLLLSTACTQKEIHDEYTQTIDSLIDVAFVDLNYVLAVDTQNTASMLPIIEEYMRFFTIDHFDINNKDLYTNELSIVATCKKYMMRSQGNLALWRNMAEVNYSQIKALKHDYSHGLITKENMQLALGEELPAITNTHKLIAKNIVSVLNCQDNLHKTIDRLDSIRLDYLAKNE